MTAPSSIDPARFLHEQLESASPDLLRSMLATFINALMSAEADAVCGAPSATTARLPNLHRAGHPGHCLVRRTPTGSGDGVGPG